MRRDRLGLLVILACAVVSALIALSVVERERGARLTELRGQGLALAFDVVVRKHGGRLDVRSTQGEGSTFTVFVPRNAREAPAA